MNQLPTASGSALKKRKAQVRFDNESDLVLVKETVAKNPFAAEYGTKGAIWSEIANVVGACFPGLEIDARRCRERCSLLADDYAAKQKQFITLTGIDEEILEIDEFLAEILELREEELRRSNKKKNVQKSKDQMDQEVGIAIREKAMETMGKREKKESRSSIDPDILTLLAKREDTKKELTDSRNKLEERRLTHEKRFALDEQRFEIERKERLALLELMAKLAERLS